MVYQFSPGISRPSGLTAQQIGESLEGVAKKYGTLTPDNVVKDATDEQHLLHPHFEWNEPKAAHLYRCTQARQIVRCVYTKMAEESPAVRAFFSVTPDESSKQYLPIRIALENLDTKDQVLSQARRELDFFHKKYNNLVNVTELYLQKLIEDREPEVKLIAKEENQYFVVLFSLAANGPYTLAEYRALTRQEVVDHSRERFGKPRIKSILMAEEVNEKGFHKLRVVERVDLTTKQVYAFKL